MQSAGKRRCFSASDDHLWRLSEETVRPTLLLSSSAMAPRPRGQRRIARLSRSLISLSVVCTKSVSIVASIKYKI